MPIFAPSRILRAVPSRSSTALKDKIRVFAQFKTNWSDTLALPRSHFPARPSLSEIELYRQRCADDLYAWQRRHRPTVTATVEQQRILDDFVLHDGPPYANGAVHVGHALNKILKDLILRSELSQGRRVQYTPGWDCHGLPIELKALQQPTAPSSAANAKRDSPRQEVKAAKKATEQMTASEIRYVARKLASETIEAQKKSFREWGVMGEWDTPYTTMDKDFELRQLSVFRELVRNGLISRHHRPVYWSPSSRTALAEAELEYDDNHKCTAAFVKMPIVRLPEVLKSIPAIKFDSLSALIWTTTPWTLPANKAVAVKKDIDYCVIEVSNDSDTAQSSDQMLVAKDRLDHVLSYLPEGSAFCTIVDSITGAQLADGQSACYNLFSASDSPLLQAEFVTATSGTGLVHMAPGHGMEDYQVCQQSGIGLAFAPVDDEGKYTADAFPASDGKVQFAGLDVQTQGVRAVLEVLASPGNYMPEGVHQSRSSLVLASHLFTHNNPIDWRTKQPVITRATAQWFADISAIKDRALAALEDVQFIPESGRTRLRSFIESRSQWCISRQRAWGVPIPALYHSDTGEACITDESINHIVSVIEQRGVDAWFSDPKDDPTWLHPSLEVDKWVRGTDTMDVWFDSGTSWTLLARKDNDTHLSDVYIEGSDQHRGWFQSSLLTAIASQDSSCKPLAPFRQLATHGFTLDGDGKKMSKSLGNVVSPDEIISGSLVAVTRGKNKKGQSKAAPPTKAQKSTLGPDVLRLWVASSDYTRDVAISQPVLQSVQQALQKYRVTFKFLLGVLHDYPAPASDHLRNLDFADHVVLQQLERTSNVVFHAYRQYKFYAGINEINKFVINDLSAFYFEIVKDKLYTGSTNARRHTQTIMFYILQELTKMLGPVTPLLVEEVWEWMPLALKSENEDALSHPLRQVWHRPFHTPISLRHDEEELAIARELFRRISSAVKLAQEDARGARRLGSGLACRVEIHIPDDSHLRSPQLASLSWLDGGGSDELAGLLVVSQADVLFSPSEPRTPSEPEVGQKDKATDSWRYEQPVELILDGKAVAGKVVVLPPAKEKCPRCWKYVADEADLPCGPCAEVAMAAEA